MNTDTVWLRSRTTGKVGLYPVKHALLSDDLEEVGSDEAECETCGVSDPVAIPEPDADSEPYEFQYDFDTNSED